MDSGAINISTGPVRITPAVKTALAADPVSHRSDAFLQLYASTTHLLSQSFNVKSSFLLTGSGTLANEAMLHQVKQIQRKGLILSNGEFGNRLISQAQRIQLEFSIYSLPWGECFQLTEIENLLKNEPIAWILFTHCETSTGVVNDLDAIAKLGHRFHCKCFADCMSTVGTRPIDLSNVTMATASSGKGLASVPGLAIVFSNIEPTPNNEIPSYIDLGLYAGKGGIPFTISSNLVSALLVSLKQKLVNDQYILLEKYREKISALLQQATLAPFDHTPSFVFTITPPADEYRDVLAQLSKAGMIISYESDYLKKRGWIQLALFNFYQEDELLKVINSLKKLRALSY
jgi:aspartate aminotransferase-like enzyme